MRKITGGLVAAQCTLAEAAWCRLAARFTGAAPAVYAAGVSNAPIGIFDSGIGGLTVARAVRERLPNETLLYLGDTARLPYGTKSPEVVRRYTLTCARFLVDKGAKMVVIACNTATAHGLEALSGLGVPVIGVIKPGAELAARRSRSGRIGVIGTEGAVQSGSYQAALAQLLPKGQVTARACPMFVPLAEEGLVAHAATKLLATDYLAPLVAERIDTLVLGCTHYPILVETIREVVGAGVEVIDSATAVAGAVHQVLEQHGLAARQKQAPDRFFATDVGQRFARVGRAFWGGAIDEVETVDL
jgi:glutamate racemase